MNELETALYGALTGGTALTNLLGTATSVYNSLAPRDAVFPLVIFNLQAGGDSNDTPTRNKELLYLVKAVSAVGPKQAGEVDAQIDDLLHGHTLTVSGWTNYWLMRTQDIAYQETNPEGGGYWHVGGIYRISLAR